VYTKARDEPVAIFEPVGPASAVGNDRQEELGPFAQARKAYRAQNSDEAELILFNLKRLYPSTPLYSYSSEQATRYRPELVGPRWDGVDAFDSK
jgi:adenylate cyclase